MYHDTQVHVKRCVEQPPLIECTYVYFIYNSLFCNLNNNNLILHLKTWLLLLFKPNVVCVIYILHHV